MAAVLKAYFPSVKIAFMGRAYTKAVIESCIYVDEFIDVTDFMSKPVTVCGEVPQAIIHVLPKPEIAKRSKQLKIPLRIGTRNRLYHWRTCNKLVKLSRKNSDLHEAQLNLILLSALGIEQLYERADIGSLYGMERITPLQKEFAAIIQKDKYNLIIHPKSQGNGREWPLEKFAALIEVIDREKTQVFISGTEKERKLLDELFDKVGDRVTDITDKMSLPQFISFIKSCDGLLASGTGPLHIAAALGKDALGLFPPIRPVHPGRWEPLGPGAKVFVSSRKCGKCKDVKTCRCMNEIKPEQVNAVIEQLATQTAISSSQMF